MNQERLLQWLEKEQEKDRKELQNRKINFIKEIKVIKKEDIIKPVETPKLTLWQKIKKVLMG
jgi:hypothetical protein